MPAACLIGTLADGWISPEVSSGSDSYGRPNPTVRADADSSPFDDRLRRLTPRQKDCLRLVVHGHQSKSIARELGISPLRVDKHISDARKILGVSDRAEAARLLQIWEQGDAEEGVPPWGAPSLGLPKNRDLLSKPIGNDSVEDPVEPKAPMPPSPAESLSYAYGAPGSLHWRTQRPGKRTDNDLGIPWTFALLAAIAAVVVAAGAIASLLLSLSQPHL